MASSSRNRNNHHHHHPSVVDKGMASATKKYEGIYQPTATTLATIAKMEEKGYFARRLERGTRVYVYDSSCRKYSWLLPGWIVEERILPRGRLYKYYYDPSGAQYPTKYEVLNAWEKLGLCLID